MSRFIITLVVLSVISFGYTAKDVINVGTVLFTESDTTKDCWSTDNMALLTSRMLLEDVLPHPSVLDIRDNAFVTDVIDYFRLVLEVVRQSTYGKTKHIMLLALTDTLGGYLHVYVLPIAKYAYYAGRIDFGSMEKLYQLFEELKCFLRTNGHGWGKAVEDFDKSVQPQPLPVQAVRKCDPCIGLTYYKQPCKDGKSGIKIPLPFFDSKTNPTAIAVPFKTYSLRNIESKSASYIVVKYYMAATKCLTYRNASKNDLAEFNGNLLAWIQIQVKPHLSKEKFYSAFGGVLRIVATLNQKGTKPINNKEIGSYNIMPESSMARDNEQNPKDANKKKSNLILMVLLSTIFIWFLLGSLFICYRTRAAQNNTKCECNQIEEVESKSIKSKSSTTYTKSGSKSSNSSKAKKPSSSSKSSKTKKSTTTSAKSVTPSACSICCSEESGVSKKKSSLSTVTPNSDQMKCEQKAQGSQRSKRSKQSQNKADKNSTNVCSVTCTYLKNLPDKYLTNSSSEDKVKQPFVYGYDLEPSLSDQSTPRDTEENKKPDFK